MPQPNLPPLPLAPPATNRLAMFGTVLRDLAGRTGGTGVRAAVDAQRAWEAQQRQMAAQQALVDSLMPRQGQQLGPGQSAFDAEMAGRLPPPGQGGIPTVAQAYPNILRAQQAGVPTSDLLSMLEKAQPDMAVSNGVAYDRRDPTNLGRNIGVNLTNNNGFMVDAQDQRNAGRYYPDLEPGQQPLFDQSGNVVAIRNMDGAVQAVSQRAEAAARAEAAGRAPYQRTETPNPDGSVTVGGADRLLGTTYTGPTPAQAATAATAAQAAIGLPQVISKAESTLGLIEGMLSHPGLENRTGWGSIMPVIPNSPGAAFQGMADQIKGKAFLEAFESLKGGGAITEREGSAATQAIARLNQNQSPEDYRAALNELAGIVRGGLERARAMASSQPPSSPAAPAARPGGAVPLADVEAEMRRRGLIP